MKTIYFIRHAKTIHDGVTPDFERFLEPRGHGDARLMAGFLKRKNISIEKLISSPALRALQTAQILANELEIKRKIKQIPSLYASKPGIIIEVINDIKDKFSSVAIVGHNNEISEVCSLLCSQDICLPTCAICAISFEAQSFKDIEVNSGKLDFFLSPKMLKDGLL